MASQSQAVTLSVWAYAAGSCASLEAVTATVNDAERSVAINATQRVPVGPVLCGQIYVGYQELKVSFVPKATGTYRISAQNFQDIPYSERNKLGSNVAPTGNLSLEVE